MYLSRYGCLTVCKVLGQVDGLTVLYLSRYGCLTVCKVLGQVDAAAVRKELTGRVTRISESSSPDASTVDGGRRREHVSPLRSENFPSREWLIATSMGVGLTL